MVLTVNHVRDLTMKSASITAKWVTLPLYDPQVLSTNFNQLVGKPNGIFPYIFSFTLCRDHDSTSNQNASFYNLYSKSFTNFFTTQCHASILNSHKTGQKQINKDPGLHPAVTNTFDHLCYQTVLISVHYSIWCMVYTVCYFLR